MVDSLEAERALMDEEDARGKKLSAEEAEAFQNRNLAPPGFQDLLPKKRQRPVSTGNRPS